MTPRSKQFFRFSILVSLLFIYDKTASQNCACAAFTEVKAKLKSKPDYNIAAVLPGLINSNNPGCKAGYYELLARSYFQKKEYDSASYNLKKAESLYLSNNCKDNLFSTYELWGQLLHSKGDIPGALQQFLKTAEAAEQTGDSYRLAVAYTMIAQMFNQSAQPDNGLNYTRKAIALIDRVNNLEDKAELLFKISHRLLWHYQETKTVTSLDSSEYFNTEMIKIASAIHSKKYLGAGYLGLQGKLWERWYHKRSNPLTAAGMDTARRLVSLLDSALKYTDRNTYNLMGSIYSDKAVIAMELIANPKDARRFTDSCVYYWEKTGNISYRVFEYQNIAGAYKVEGDYKGAYEYYKKAKLLEDSLDNIEKTELVAELEKKYNQAKNETTIKALDKKKQLYLFLAITGLLAVFTIAFFLRQQSLKHKKSILETEQRLNRARMNPHFFFNALSSLQSFALEGNDGKSIASNLSKFSHIMRETLESTYKEYVTIEQETDFLKEYLELQRIRFPQKFSYEVIISDKIEPEETLIPSMILQPFAENSIEHGFTGIGYTGHITIQFSSEGKELHISIIDNGKGLATTAKENNEHISRASQIIKDRIYLLNIKLKTKAAFSIENNANGKGVAVLVKLPLLFKQDIKA